MDKIVFLFQIHRYTKASVLLYNYSLLSSNIDNNVTQPLIRFRDNGKKGLIFGLFLHFWHSVATSAVTGLPKLWNLKLQIFSQSLPDLFLTFGSNDQRSSVLTVVFINSK